jgi:hypothetical protein
MFKTGWEIIKQRKEKVLIFLVLLVYALTECGFRNDFDIYMSAARDLNLKKDFYTATYYEWYHYYYDLLFVWLLSFFTQVPIFLVKWVWVIFNLFLIVKLYQRILFWLPLKGLKEKQKIIFHICCLLIGFRFLKDNLHLGQMTIFILFLIVEGLYQLRAEKKGLGALFLALGISIKILPLVFLPYLLYRKEWKTLFYIVFWVFAITIVPMFFVGWEYGVDLLSKRVELLNPNNVENIVDTLERSYHSLTTLLATLMLENDLDKYALPLRRNIWNVSVETLAWVIQVVRLFFVAFTLYFLRTFPFRKSLSPLHQFYEMSYLLLVTPLIFPHQQYYAFVFAIPAAIYLLRIIFITSYRTNKFLIIGLTLVFLVFNSTILLGTFREYYDHYKIITYASLLLMILLACHPPRDVYDNTEET